MHDLLPKMSDLQTRIDAWCREQFPEQTPETVLRHLVEEVRELEQMRNREEAADCLILLLAYAGLTDEHLVHDMAASQIASRLRISADELLTCAEWGNHTGGEARHFLGLLLAWCAVSGVNLVAAAEEKHAINLTRRWRRGDDGLHHHIPEAVQ